MFVFCLGRSHQCPSGTTGCDNYPGLVLTPKPSFRSRCGPATVALVLGKDKLIQKLLSLPWVIDLLLALGVITCRTEQCVLPFWRDCWDPHRGFSQGPLWRSVSRSVGHEQWDYRPCPSFFKCWVSLKPGLLEDKWTSSCNMFVAGPPQSVCFCRFTYNFMNINFSDKPEFRRLEIDCTYLK